VARLFLMRWLGRSPWINETRLQTIGILAATVLAALSYCAMPGADRPELEPSAPAVWFGQRVAGPPAQPEWFVQIYWTPLGRKLARCGFVTVYAVDQNGVRQNRLGTRLMGSGDRCENVTFGFLTVPLALSDFPNHLLICASYRDESGKKYRQAFHYRVLPPEHHPGPPPSSSASLEEQLPRLSEKVCR
jgi:hypothetical protein